MAKKLSESVVAAIRAFMQTDRAHRCVFDRRISALGVKRGQNFALAVICREKKITQKRLADVVGVSPAAVTVTVKRLEADGLVTRERRESDNRVIDICPTKKGAELFSETKHVFAGVDAAMFDGFSDAELETLTGYLSRMRKNLRAAEDGTLAVPDLSESDVFAIAGKADEK